MTEPSADGVSHERIDANPDTDLPDWMGNPSTKADPFGLWVLCVRGRCSCGYHGWGVAPDWKVPAEWGGAFMTKSCPDCLGTVEYSDEWQRVDRLVSDYSQLKPCEVQAGTQQEDDTDE